jgi:hypothetical protein
VREIKVKEKGNYRSTSCGPCNKQQLATLICAQRYGNTTLKVQQGFFLFLSEQNDIMGV